MFYSYESKKFESEIKANPISIAYTTRSGRGVITLNPERVFPCTVHDVKTIIDTLWISADPYGIAEQIADYMRACVAEIQETRAKYSGPFDAKTRSQLSGLIKKYISNLDKIADAFGFESITDCDVDNMKMKKCEVLCNEVDHNNENGTGRTIRTYAGKTFTKAGIIFQVHQKKKKGVRWITLPGTGAAVISYNGAEKEAPEHIDERIIDILKKNAESDKLQFVRADFVRVCNACGIEPDEIQADFVKPAEQPAESATVSAPVETETTTDGPKAPAISSGTNQETETSEESTPETCKPSAPADRQQKPETGNRPQNVEQITTKETRTRAPYYIITRAERPQVWKHCIMTAGRKNGIIYAGNCAKTQTGSRQKTDRAERLKTACKILGYKNIPLTDKNPVTGAERSHKAMSKLAAYAHGRPPDPDRLRQNQVKYYN